LNVARVLESSGIRARVMTPAWVVLACSLLLSCLGLYSIGLSEPLRVLPGEAPVLAGAVVSKSVVKQVVFLVIGLVAAAMVAGVGHKRLSALAPVLAIGTVAILVFLLVPWVPSWIVRPQKGARGWINMGVADLQPAEFAKITYVLVIAWYLRYRETHRRFWGLVPVGLLTMVPVGLITLQPDLGTAMLFVPSLFAMLIAAGARLRHLCVIVIIGAMAAPMAYPLLRPHQKSRLVGLWKQFQGDTSADRDLNFQSLTAQAMIGAGGMTGQPAANARALLHFNALPERHSDMIPAVIGVRFGIVGLGIVAVLVLGWALAALATAAATVDPVGRLTCVGLAFFVLPQAALNLAMNSGMAPIVGVGLPFVSSGGSSMLSAWLMTGLVLGVGLRRNEPTFRTPFEFSRE